MKNDDLQLRSFERDENEAYTTYSKTGSQGYYVDDNDDEEDDDKLKYEINTYALQKNKRRSLYGIYSQLSKLVNRLN